MLAVTAEQMRRLDSTAISLGIAGSLLMENAACALVCEALREKPSTVLVFCGKGQNGGDGFAAARQLFCLGTDVKIILAVSPEEVTGDAAVNMRAAKNIGVPMESYENGRRYFCDVIIDALLGTGIKGTVRQPIANVIEAVNESGAFVISADIPSGISADTGRICGCAVKSDKTVTFGFCKAGLFSPLSADYTGEIVHEQISIPPSVAGTEDIKLYITEPTDIALTPVSRSAHKGTNGKVLIAGGKKGMAGAVLLAARAASKSGAGLVTCGVPSELLPILMKRITTAMCADIESVDFSAFDAVVFGNGIGTGKKAEAMLSRALSDTKGTLVIDADGINLLSADLTRLRKSRAEIILTPHPAEFSRLTNIPVGELIENRVLYSQRFASEYGVTVVFKGAYSVVAFPNGTAYINTTGNEGMAKGGSGDVLAGMLGGMAKHFSDAPHAARAAVYLHGLAGDMARASEGNFSMTAADIIRYIPKAFKKI